MTKQKRTNKVLGRGYQLFAAFLAIAVLALAPVFAAPQKISAYAKPNTGSPSMASDGYLVAWGPVTTTLQALLDSNDNFTNNEFENGVQWVAELTVDGRTDTSGATSGPSGTMIQSYGPSEVLRQKTGTMRIRSKYKANSTPPSSITSKSFVFNNDYQEISVSGGSNYSVSGNRQFNVGTYNISASPTNSLWSSGPSKWKQDAITLGTITITPGANAWTATDFAVNSKSYDGLAVAPSATPTAKWGAVTVEYTEKGQENWTTTAPVEVGEWTARATMEESNNWTRPATTSYSTEFVISPGVLDLETEVQNLLGAERIYSGTAYTGITASEKFTVTGENTATDAGTYTVKIKPTSHYGWSDTDLSDIAASQAERTFTWTILPKKLNYAASDITTSNKTYNGTEQTFASGSGLTAPANSTIQSVVKVTQDMTSAGEKTLTVTLRANQNYTFDTANRDTKEFTVKVNVTQATNAWTGALTSAPAKTQGEAFAHTATASFGKAIIEYKKASEAASAYSTAVPTVAGKYTVRARIAGTGDYTGLTGTDVVFDLKPVKPAAQFDCKTSMLTGYPSGGVCEYNVNGDAWRTLPDAGRQINDLNVNDIIYVRFKETATVPASDAQEIKITKYAKPVIALDPRDGGSLTGLTDGTYLYRILDGKDGDNITGVGSFTVTGGRAAISSLGMGYFVKPVNAGLNWKLAISIDGFQNNLASDYSVGVEILKMLTPQASIAYANGKLTGLENNLSYRVTVDGTEAVVTSSASGEITIKTEWVGKTVVLCTAGNATDRLDSAPQTIVIDAETTPAAVVDTVNNTVKNLVANANYTVNGTAYTASADGSIAIDPSWLGKNVTIIKKSNGTSTVDSLAQTLAVPTREAQPSVTVDYVNTKLTVTGADGTYYIKSASGAPVIGETFIVTGGKAEINRTWLGRDVTIAKKGVSGTIDSAEFALTMPDSSVTPAANIDLRVNELTGLVANKSYIAVVNGVRETFNSNGDGKYVIPAAWHGKSVSLITPAVAASQLIESIPQVIAVPTRETAPVANAIVFNRAHNRIEGFVPNAVYLVSAGQFGFTAAEEFTADANGYITVDDAWLMSQINIIKKGVDGTIYSPATQSSFTVPDREPKPEASLDKVNNQIVGLEPGADYFVNGERFTADEEGKLDILDKWYDKDIEIERVTTDEQTLDSHPQVITLPKRETVGEVVIEYTNAALTGLNDGVYIVVIEGETTTREFTAADGKLALDESWLGKKITLIKKGEGEDGARTFDSAAFETATLPVREAVPDGKYMGKTATEVGRLFYVDGTVAYSLDGGVTFTLCPGTEFDLDNITVENGIILVKKSDGVSTIDSHPQTITITKATAITESGYESTLKSNTFVDDTRVFIYHGNATYEYALFNATGARLTPWTTPDNDGKITFSGLSRDTQYTVKARKEGSVNALFGDSTNGFMIKTYREQQVNVSVDLGGFGANYTLQTTKGVVIRLLETPAYDGKAFLGWYRDAAFTTEWKLDRDVPEADMTIYAKWADQAYTVTLKPGGGYADEILEGLAEGSYITLPVNFAPVGFAGWYKDAGFKSKWNFERDTVKGDITLYGRWITTEYKVTFDAKGGSKVDSAKVVYGGSVSRPEDPTREGYVFAGWYSDSSLTARYYFDVETVTANQTLYAKWTKNAYSISGSVTDAKGAPVAGAKIDLTAGSGTVATTVTDGQGIYRFDAVADGVYNVVYRDTLNASERNISKMARVEGEDAIADIEVPYLNYSTEVEVKPGAPDITAEGLGNLFGDSEPNFTDADRQAAEKNGYVKFKLTVEQKNDRTRDSLATRAKNNKLTLGNAFDITLDKLVFDGNSTHTSRLSSVSSLIEIAIPLDAKMLGSKQYSVYRIHNGETQTIRTTANEEGEYFTLSADGKVLTLYVKNFSSYAIGYQVPVDLSAAYTVFWILDSILLIAIIVFLFLIKRRKNRLENNQSGGSGADGTAAKSEVQTESAASPVMAIALGAGGMVSAGGVVSLIFSILFFIILLPTCLALVLYYFGLLGKIAGGKLVPLVEKPLAALEARIYPQVVDATPDETVEPSDAVELPAAQESAAATDAAHAGFDVGVERAAFAFGRQNVFDFVTKEQGTELFPAELRIAERKRAFFADTLYCGKRCCAMAFERNGVMKLVFRANPATFDALKAKHDGIKRAKFPKGVDWCEAVVDSSFENREEACELLATGYRYVLQRDYPDMTKK